MFEFFFKYPPAIFSKGKLVLLGPWPAWVMLLLLILAAGGVYWFLRQRSAVLSRVRLIAIGIAVWRVRRSK